MIHPAHLQSMDPAALLLLAADHKAAADKAHDLWCMHTEIETAILAEQNRRIGLTQATPESPKHARPRLVESTATDPTVGTPQ